MTEQQQIETAKRRLAEVRSRAVTPIPMTDVTKQIRALMNR